MLHIYICVCVCVILDVYSFALTIISYSPHSCVKRIAKEIDSKNLTAPYIGHLSE